MNRFLLAGLPAAAILALGFTLSATAAPGPGTPTVLNLIGTGTAYPGTVPDIDGDGFDDPADCFDVDLVNLENGKVVGTATDCLADVTPVGDRLALIGTTYFNLPQGTLITRGATTVQPVTHGSPGFTHITGATPSGGSDVIGGTGPFSGATGSVRLSGAVDMSALGSDGQITFDCIFVVNLD